MKNPVVISISTYLKRAILLSAALFVLLPQSAAAGFPDVVKRVCEWVTGTGKASDTPALVSPSFRYRQTKNIRTPEEYHVKYEITSTYEEVWAQGTIGRHGGHRDLELYIVMYGEKGTRVPGFRGPDQYQKIVEHFAGRFDRIQGAWYGHAPHNLNQVNALTMPPEGLSLEEAAKKTWSGRQAAKFGYTEVKVDYDDENGTDGSPGYYEQVIVYFSKPAN